MPPQRDARIPVRHVLPEPFEAGGLLVRAALEGDIASIVEERAFALPAAVERRSLAMLVAHEVGQCRSYMCIGHGGWVSARLTIETRRGGAWEEVCVTWTPILCTTDDGVAGAVLAGVLGRLRAVGVERTRVEVADDDARARRELSDLGLLPFDVAGRGLWACGPAPAGDPSTLAVMHESICAPE